MIEIAPSSEGRRIFYSDTDAVEAVRALEEGLSGFQTAVQCSLTSTPRHGNRDPRRNRGRVAPALGPGGFDIDNYASEIVTTFDLATRVEGVP